MSENLDNKSEVVVQAQDFPTVQETAVDPVVFTPQVPAADSRPFVSRFNQWMKVIAIVVLSTFIPDQISWAFGYNPAVLYKNLPTMYTMPEAGMPAMKSAPQVAGSVEYLLKQIQDKPKLRLELNLDATRSRSLEIDTKTTFSADKIKQITQWLNTPNLNILNCGVYALKDVLEANGIKRSLSEISVMTLSVDIMADIIKIGEPKLKTTLFAINKTAKALGLNYEALKLSPEDTLNLKTPFIAHFKNEHFVTVQKAAGGKVYYTDLDYPRIVDQQDFLNNADGYVFARSPIDGVIARSPIDGVIARSPIDGVIARSPQGDEAISYKIVPESFQAFVWGDKYRDLSKSLPGIMGWGSFFLQVGIAVAMMFLGGLGSAAKAGKIAKDASKLVQLLASIAKALKMTLQLVNFSLQLGALMNKLGTICVMKGACSEKEAFILSTAITMAVTMGVSAGMAASIANAAKAAATQAVQSALDAGLGQVAANVAGAAAYQAIMSGASTAAAASAGAAAANATAAALANGASQLAASAIGMAAGAAVSCAIMSGASAAGVAAAGASAAQVMTSLSGMVSGLTQQAAQLVGTAVGTAVANAITSGASAAGVASAGAAAASAAMPGATTGGITGFFQSIANFVNKIFSPINNAIHGLFGPAANTAGSSAISAAGTSAMTRAIEAFATGLVLGYLKGVVEFEITKVIDNAFCPPNPDPDAQCSGTNQILEQVAGGIASTLGAQLAVDVGIASLDSAGINVGQFFAQPKNNAWAPATPNNPETPTPITPPPADVSAPAAPAVVSAPAVTPAPPVTGAEAGIVSGAVSGAINATNVVAPSFTLNQLTDQSGNVYEVEVPNETITVTATPEPIPLEPVQLNATLKLQDIQSLPLPGVSTSPQPGTGISPNSSVSFGGLVAQTLHDSLPNIAGQVASGLVRLAALKAGVQPEDNLSNALGMGANMIASTFVSNEINPGQSQSMSYQVVKALFGFGMGFAENSIIGRYDQKEAQINPAYAYDYSESQAEFQAVTMVASSVLTAGLFATFPKLPEALNKLAGNASSGTSPAPGAANSTWSTRFIDVLFNISLDTTYSSVTRPDGKALVPSSSIPTPAVIPGFLGGVGGASLLGGFGQTTSWATANAGGVSNFVNYSDIQDQMYGFTADSAVAAENQWTVMQENNHTDYGPAARTVGGLITAGTVTKPVSPSMLFDQFIVSQLESRSLAAPAIMNPGYLNGQLQDAALTGMINLAGEPLFKIADAMIKVGDYNNSAVDPTTKHRLFYKDDPNGNTIDPFSKQKAFVVGDLGPDGIMDTNESQPGKPKNKFITQRMRSFLLGLGFQDYQFATEGKDLGIGPMSKIFNINAVGLKGKVIKANAAGFGNNNLEVATVTLPTTTPAPTSASKSDSVAGAVAPAGVPTPTQQSATDSLVPGTAAAVNVMPSNIATSATGPSGQGPASTTNPAGTVTVVGTPRKR